jgi:hypothetical protein
MFFKHTLAPVHDLTGNALHNAQKSYIRMISSNTVYTVNSNLVIV